MTKKKKGGGRSKDITPADMRSWDNEDHRLEGRAVFLRNVAPPSPDRQPCIDSGVHARTKFAEWGRFYIEGEKAPLEFPDFDPQGTITKIPNTTVFRVYEAHESRLERDKEVILILPVAGTKPEKMDQAWRCTYTPYIARKRPKKR